MPFVNEAQRRACYAQRRRDLNEGRTPKWDCDKWNRETKKKLKMCGARCANGSKCHRMARGKCWQHK